MKSAPFLHFPETSPDLSEEMLWGPRARDGRIGPQCLRRSGDGTDLAWYRPLAFGGVYALARTLTMAGSTVAATREGALQPTRTTSLPWQTDSAV